MTKIVEGETYLTTSEAMKELGASRKRFYSNAKPLLRVHFFDAKKTPWYKKSDVLALKTGRVERKAPAITIAGMYGSWTNFAESQYEAKTELRSVSEVPLPEEIVQRFQLSADRKFVRRSRLTRIGQEPICTWDTYYPLNLVAGILEPLKQGTFEHVVEYIQEAHGVTVGFIRDIYSARQTTLEELNLFQLSRDESMLILQRAAYTRDKSTLLWVSDMALKGSWFAHEHAYEVD